MLMYRGRYRVLFETDKNGKACEFVHIPCRIRKGASICRHNCDTPNVYLPSIKIANRLIKEFPDLFKPFQVGNSEATLLFMESDMEKVAAILKARTKGKDMSARPKRQIAISDDKRKELSEKMKRIQANNKIIGEKPRKTG